MKRIKIISESVQIIEDYCNRYNSGFDQESIFVLYAISELLANIGIQVKVYKSGLYIVKFKIETLINEKNWYRYYDVCIDSKEKQAAVSSKKYMEWIVGKPTYLRRGIESDAYPDI